MFDKRITISTKFIIHDSIFKSRLTLKTLGGVPPRRLGAVDATYSRAAYLAVSTSPSTVHFSFHPGHLIPYIPGPVLSSLHSSRTVSRYRRSWSRAWQPTAPVMRTRCWSLHLFNPRCAWTMATWPILLCLWFTLAQGMRDYQIKELRYARSSHPTRGSQCLR